MSFPNVLEQLSAIRDKTVQNITENVIKSYDTLFHFKFVPQFN